MKKTSVLLSWRLPLLLSLWAAPAGAHWGMPDEASSISVRSGHEDDWIMGDASGALISRDHGTTWRWICPEGMGIAIWRPERYFWLSGGAILAATGSALVRSDDSGCTWTPHGFFKDTWVTSLAVHPVDERRLYVSTGRPSLSNGLYRSEDGGESWLQALAPTPGSQYSAIRVAASDPLRVYASGQDAEGQFLVRSDDGGRAWTRLPQPLTGFKLPYDLVLLRVSDSSPDVLWAKISAQGRDSLLKSTDGGATLTPVMDTYERISSVEASPDGRTVWVSTTTRLFRSLDEGPFTELAEPNGNACALRFNGRLYGCGPGWIGGWALARSEDEGTTWEPLFKLGDVQGAHLCPASTPVQQRCPTLWPQLATLFGAPEPDGGVAPRPDAGPAEPPSASDGCAAAPGLMPGAWLMLTVLGRRRARLRVKRGIGAGALLALVSLVAVLGGCGASDAEGPLQVPELEYGIGAPWPSPAPLPPVGPAGRLIITNNLEDTLSLLDLEGMESPAWGELARLPVGLNPVELEGPHHTAVSPENDFYYVGISNYVPGSGSGPHGAHGSGKADGYCLKLDATTHAVVGSARVDPNPGDVILSADGRTLYQTHFDLLRIAEVARRGGTEAEMDARLAILDARTMTRTAMVPVCPAPHAVRLSLDGKRAYVACWSDEVAIVDLERADHPVQRVKVADNVGTAVVPIHQPYALTVSPTTGAVWVSSLASRAVQYLDPETLTMDPARTVWLPGAPMFGAFTSDGRTLFMPYQSVDSIAVIDVAHPEAAPGEIPLAASGCLNVHQLMLTPDERHALAVCEGDHLSPGTLHVVSLEERRVVKTVQVGLFPDSVALLGRRP